MKKTNKILSVILAILMVFSIIPITASAVAPTSGTCGKNATWKFDKSTGTLTISGEGDMWPYEENTSPWYSHRANFDTVIINGGITSIGEYAFYGCSNITSVSLLGDITSINSNAFQYCDGLTSITIPDSVTIIGSYAFNGVFFDNISIPDSVITIGQSAFEDSGLKNIIIGKGLARIGSNAFTGCFALESISVDKENQNFSSDEYGVFFNKEKTTLLKFPTGSNLKHYDIPGGVTTICCKAFERCGNTLKSVGIPKSVTQIELRAFESSYSTKCFDIYYLATSDDWNEIDFETFFLDMHYGFITVHFAESECKCNYQGIVTPPTCTEQGYTRHICDYCGDAYIDDYVDALGHTEVIDERVSPTCTETGISEGKHCSVCNEVLIEQTVVPALGHTTDIVSVVEPTCTEQGYTIYSCSVCGDTYNDDYVATLEHNYTWTITKEPTCNTKGQKTGVCSDCGNEVTEAISVLGHNWGERNVDYEPTCTEQGRTCYECSRCGSKTNFQYIPATGHNYSEWVQTDEANCQEYGKYEHYCLTCGQTGVMSAKGEHDYSLENIVVAPTCTTTGSKSVECSVCGDSYTEEVPATGHSHNATITAPTCTEQGYTTYTCVCGDTYIDDYVDALGHTEETIHAVAPTCTESGLTEGVKCSVCGVILTAQETVPATGHNFISEITTPATHTTTGIMTYTCTCGVSYTEVIEKVAEHTYEVAVTQPTCTAQGYTTYTCACGDTYVDDYVDALGHTEETILAVAPTCTETGLTEGIKCSVCDEIITAQETVPANGHTLSTAVKENYVAPTCTENGSKEVVVYCSVCDEEISRETVVLESTGHADNDCDGYCDMDEELLDPSVECDHACHKDGILGFFWRIINIFNMLFGLNKTCYCGVAHY